MKVTVIDLDGKTHVYETVDRLSYVNHESYGPLERVVSASEGLVLVLNVNNFVAVEIDNE